MRKNEAVYGISYPSNRKGFIYALARRESSADLDKDDTFNQKALSVINKLGYAGLFQYGNLALIDIGYKTQNGNWTGKNGATSLKAFLASREIQIAAINLSINLWCERLRVNGFNEYYGKTVNGIEITESGCIAGCHLVGSGGLASFLNMPGNLKINRKTGKRHNEFDGNNIHISHYIKLFAGYDLENCCKRKVRIKLKELNDLPLTGKSVTIRSSYQGKYSKSSFEVTHLTDVDGELPVIVRHPGARIVLEINGRESETIIQSADSTQPYSIIASDIKVSAPLAEKGKPEPKKQGAKETVPKQDSTEEQNFTKDVDFHIAMREGDTRKPISNVKFTLVYKGNPKQHITNAQGVKENIIAEAGQKVEICMAGEGALQPIASFTVTENLRGTTVDILLPVHTFSVIVVDTKGKPVSSAEFGIFYRGKERTKKTDQEGRLKIKALVGFVYGFGNKGNPLLYLRCLQSVSVRRISVNATAVKVAQENITGKVQPRTAQQPEKTTEGQKAEQQEPVQQRNTYTEKSGKPLTVAGEGKAAKDTVRYHIYHNGTIKRENKGATGFAEFIFYDERNKAHNLGKSQLIKAQEWEMIKKDNKVTLRRVTPHRNIYLIDQRKHRKYKSSHNNIGYEWKILSKDQRFYLNASALSAVLGAMCSLEYKYYIGSGFSTKDGGSGVSISHINGKNGDFRYLGQNNAHKYGPVHTNYDSFDWEENVKFVEALYKFGYKHFLSYPVKNKSNKLLPHSSKFKDHHHHLHLQGFTPNIIDI